MGLQPLLVVVVLMMMMLRQRDRARFVSENRVLVTSFPNQLLLAQLRVPRGGDEGGEQQQQYQQPQR